MIRRLALPLDPPRPGPSTSCRDGFAQISAIEGIALDDGMRILLERFGREGLGAEERRRAIAWSCFSYPEQAW